VVVLLDRFDISVHIAVTQLTVFCPRFVLVFSIHRTALVSDDYIVYVLVISRAVSLSVVFLVDGSTCDIHEFDLSAAFLGLSLFSD
jgi:hypothetical protein